MPRRSLTCSDCGRLMQTGATSLPQGQATCHPCRRKRNPPKPPTTWRAGDLLFCAVCTRPFEQLRPRQKYCSAECRGKRYRVYDKRPAAERGYGPEHRQLRREWQPEVEAGRAFCHAAICLMGDRWIEPGSRWDLGHTQDRTTWTGPEHAKCNRTEGAKRAGGWTNMPVIEKPCATCHQAFVTTYPKQRYCSSRCRPKRKPKAKPLWTRALNECPTCGALHTNPTYCSAECRASNYAPRVTLRPCTACGAEMECRQGVKQYCSPTCHPSHASGAQQRKRARARGGAGSISAGAAP